MLPKSLRSDVTVVRPLARRPLNETKPSWFHHNNKKILTLRECGENAAPVLNRLGNDWGNFSFLVKYLAWLSTVRGRTAAAPAADGADLSIPRRWTTQV